MILAALLGPLLAGPSDLKAYLALAAFAAFNTLSNAAW